MPKKILSLLLLLPFALSACTLSLETTGFPTLVPGSTPIWSSSASTGSQVQGAAVSPTPDSPHILPPLRTESVEYTIQSGDTLLAIAQTYGIGLQTLLKANPLADPNLIQPGQTITVPPPQPVGTAPSNKILPDSGLVYGPHGSSFDIAAYLAQSDGYLAAYRETVNGESLSAAEIIRRISVDYSVDPRLLLALTEYFGGWVTQSQPAKAPLGDHFTWLSGLDTSLQWAAHQLNWGYYIWKIDGLGSMVINDEQVYLPSPTVNAATASIQHLLGLLTTPNQWQTAVSPSGFYATYQQLFDDPFQSSIEPLVPVNLAQPSLQLPFEQGVAWSFTGGPHGGWDSSSAWAALDFAPAGDLRGCYQSDAWVTAVAAGTVIRSERGELVLDLDGDGLEGTGWIIFYLHLETRDRLAPGTRVQAGDRLGHPSCEGGASNGTHVHIARRYNGEWISADRELPFNLDGWVSAGTGQVYDGTLSRQGNICTAYNGSIQDNEILR